MIGEQPRHVIGYMKDFLFAPSRRAPLGVLSGGERGRVMLARALAKRSNVLVLDEPTNDLDLETLDVLEEMLGDYAGTVILISHDRDFLDRVVNAVIAPEGGGRAGWNMRAAIPTCWRNAARYCAHADQADVAEKPEGAQAAKRADAGQAAAELHEKHALETLPKTIAALQAKVRALHDRLADPALYARDRQAFEEASAALAAAQAELTAAEEKWLELEILREEVAGG